MSKDYSKAIAEFKEKVANPQWTTIPYFPGYEQNLFRHVREVDTKNRVQPHVISKARRNEGLYVDLLNEGKTHIVRLDDLFHLTFPNER
jgi:hypothetical protein